MAGQRTVRRSNSLALGFLVLWLVGLSTACNEGSGLLPGERDFRFGAVEVRAFDQQSSPVEGVTMELRDSRGTLLWGDLNKTGPDGRVGFNALIPGSHTITIKPPTGYAVPASQPNPFGVEVKNSQSITINVFLLRLLE
ncbi:MAG TPA: hypothetical protein VN493_04610 [Thermoanaerobaculia bacterium]|nr:hypothetical protein [Thermoanaerobaculia bacterium]